MGNVGGYHTAVTVNPTSGVGVVLLMAGAFPDSGELVYDTYEILQPAFDAALADATEQLYAGEWRLDGGGGSDAHVLVDDGTLYIDRLTLFGQDALKTLGAEGRVALRPTRKDEFRSVYAPSTFLRSELTRLGCRIDVGLAALNGKRHEGCMPYWVTLDEWGMRNNATINAVYFSGAGDERMLHIPSLAMVMTRVGE